MASTDVIRLVSVDGHPIFRAGIKLLCAPAPDLCIVGEAGRVADALGLCERLRPDLVLLDGGLAGAVSLLAQLRERQPDLGVVVFVEQVDETLLARVLQLGCRGFLLKQIEGFDLIQAVRSVARGNLTLAPEAAAAVFGRSARAPALLEALSEREQAVLDLLLDGLPNDTIAARLLVSRATVKFHLRNIYSKLGVRTRTEALALVFGKQRPGGARAGEAVAELPWRGALAAVI